MHQGNVNEAINELTNIQTKKEIQWATILALIYYHSLCQTVDRVNIIMENLNKFADLNSIYL
jgi:hypothetical protein